MIKKLLSKIDYGIIISVVVLFAIGIVGLYSASRGAGGDESEFSKQLIWFGVGLVCFVLTMSFSCRKIKDVTIIAYVVFIALLVGVLFTNRNNGATSWYKIGMFSFQPAEFFKIIAILFLAKLISDFSDKDSLNKITSILILLLVLAIPVGLIIKQPDYGTAIVIVFVFCMMLYVAGINYKYIIAGALIAVISLPIIYNVFLPEHAKSRINVFLNPEADPKGAGYNIIQSKLAVGSGMVSGMGVMNGNQTQLGMLPMKTTDFIYSVISEEMGFIISPLIIVLYIFMLYRILKASNNTKDMFGKMVCIGVFAMLLAHVVENIGMTIGLMPITGIPLPFISYGGSSMITNFIAIGLVENILIWSKNYGL
jgi:rod shape determining protein RodA